jgi:hypothetical protein
MSHKSLATTITEERILALNKIHRHKIRFEIKDLQEENNATGTKVLIELPLR